MPEPLNSVMRAWIARAFMLVEDVVYVGLGLLLTVSAIVLLIWSAISFAQGFGGASIPANVIGLLDRMLLVLLIVELLYTVQVSFREHTIVPEPFLLVGMIAAVRRVLVLTAEFGQGMERSEPMFQEFIIELIVLTVLILVLVISLILLRKRAPIAADRA